MLARRMIVAMLLVLTGCTGTGTGAVGGQSAPVGTVIDERVTDGLGGRTWVVIPEGRIDFVVTEPREDYPAYHEEYDRADDSGSFVGVTWDWDFHTQIGSVITDKSTLSEPSFALVVDGREYSLDDAMLRSADEGWSGRSDDPALDFGGTAWVVVSGEPDDVDLRQATIRATYDGHTQEVSLDGDPRDGDLGPANVLYGLNSGALSKKVDCGPPNVARGLVLNNASCLLDVMRVPWYQPVGWAEPGQVLVVVTIRGWVQSVYRGVRAHFLDGPVAATYTLNGAEPLRVLPMHSDELDSGSLAQTVVFAVSQDELGSDLVVDAAFVTGDGVVPRVEVPAKWKMDLWVP